MRSPSERKTSDDKVDPNCAKSKTDNAAPKRIPDLIDSEEARQQLSKSATVDPRRAKALKENDEPRLTKSRTERDAPMRLMPNTDIDAPYRLKDRSDNVDPT